MGTLMLAIEFSDGINELAFAETIQIAKESSQVFHRHN
jgi:hypothetical protein